MPIDKLILFIGNTALMIAAAYGHDKVVSLLIEEGANIHLQNNNGESTLKVSINYQHNMFFST